jgi:hypothetical protein
MFWKKKEQEKFDSVIPTYQPVEAYPVPDKSSVDARIDEALEKLISKIKEKHFSPEIQNALKEMQGPLSSKIYFSINGRSGISLEFMTISIDDIDLGYSISLYNNYKDKPIRERLIHKLPRYDYDNDIGKYKRGSEKSFINYIYDYFFGGELEKDIEKKTQQNRDYEKQKEAMKLQVADELCAKLKDLNIS